MGLKAVANLGGGGGGGISGSGTPGKLAKFTGATALGDSLLSESGTTITSAATAETFGSAQTWTVGAPNSQALVVLSNAGAERTLVLDTISRAVGVGVPTTPATLLHVSDGVTTFAGTAGAGVRLDRATEALFSSSDGTRSFRAGITASTAVVGTSTAHDLLLQRGNVTAATLQSGAIASVTLTAGGAGYTSATYSQQALTGGTGTGATADIVVAGGVVTSCVLRSPGTGYAAADALSCATIGAGAGFVLTVATIAQIVAGSGNLTALGRIGAGTANPRAALDVQGGAAFVSGYDTFAQTATGTTSNVVASIFEQTSFVLAGSQSLFYGVRSVNTWNFTSATAAPTAVAFGGGGSIIGSPAGVSFTYYGALLTPSRNNSSDLSTSANVYACYASAGVNSGVGSSQTAIVSGVSAIASNNVSGHTVTTLTGVQSQLLASAGAIVGTGYGFNVPAVTSASTWTTYYGLRLQSWSNATVTNRWGISQEDTLASNQFSAVTNTFSGIVRATGSTAAAPAFSTPADPDTGMYFPSANTVRIGTSGSPGLEIDSSQNLKFNSGYGSATTAYGCRAWANWNNVGVIAIRASGGVSSLTDDGVGVTGVNFSFTMPDLNYCLSGMRQPVGSNTTAYYDSFTNVVGPTFIRSTTACHVIGYDGGGASDSPNVNLAIFR